MSMINEQVKALRDVAQAYKHNGLHLILREAADTIEALTAKLQAANMEKSMEKNDLKKCTDMPKVEINGKRYVDKEMFLNLLDKRILEERKDCPTEEERNGIDICRNIIANWR